MKLSSASRGMARVPRVIAKASLSSGTRARAAGMRLLFMLSPEGDGSEEARVLVVVVSSQVA
ncbi:hypothetical protein D3C84_1122630 [compost metagenome]